MVCLDFIRVDLFEKLSWEEVFLHFLKFFIILTQFFLQMVFTRLIQYFEVLNYFR